MSAAKKLAAALGLALLLAAVLAPAGAQAAFGIQSLEVTALNEDKSVDTQAGSHPFEFTTSLVMNQDAEERPEGTLRELVAELPPGMAGNPLAAPRCTGAQFEGQLPKCPGNTQVGVASVKTTGLPPFTGIPVYNLTPPLGTPASIGLSIFSDNSFQEASLRSGEDYGVNISDLTLPTDRQIQAITETIWGVPAAAAHDSERQCFDSEGNTVHGCSTDTAEKPFLTLPTSCGAPLQTTVRIDSLQNPGAFVSETVESRDEHGNPAGMNRCERLSFEPTIKVQPETAAADSPSGLHVDLNIPQNESPAPGQVATAHLKDAVVTLPAGIAVNPSSADGLGVCTEAQVGFEGFQGKRPRFTGAPANCPPSSQMGTVEVQSPLVDHPLPGTVYLAKQKENPFGALIALYLTVDDPVTGVVVKLPGKVVPDPVTGQLKTSFEENPQLPFEDFTLQFTGGPRAALTTPPICGTYTTTTDLTPWSTPEGADAKPSDPFKITGSPSGGPCAANESQLPNSPSFEAGTAQPLAGSFSPFVVKMSRENGSQRFGALNTTLPAGVSAKLAGVAECSNAQIAQAQARSHEGEGALEKASPSCPQASRIGVVNVGAGSGNPFYVQGNVYLAGPYKGAPLSLAIITPAVAGPFDLGVVVVRAALFLNEETAQATVKSDPLPSILFGIPLDVRTIAVKIDRSGFALNPTSCEEKAVSGEEVSIAGAVATLHNRFQVGGCKGLGYSPNLALSMKGGTKRSGHPALKTVLTQPSGQANSSRVVLILPPSEFIDPLRTANPCTRPQFAEEKCPAASILGKAKVFTPLLDKPLEGNVYFRANGGARELPDAVADLHGQVHVVLVGFVDSVHKKGSEVSRVRTTFANVPDAPVTKAIVELRGGKKGVLVNSANLCKVPNKATVKMTAQNGKTHDFNPRIGTSCSK